ncbi:MAG: hypothetical protein IJ252_08405 [Solobacterium sp.]|nr:hypothetical protein [Solobacterium sp.]
MSLFLIASGVFYGVLCVFSIVTGCIYMSGKRQLNPLELSDSFVAKLDTPEKMSAFAKKMGFVTVIVGIVQGITSYSILVVRSPVCWWIAFGFNLFSICSVLFKLKGKISSFPLLKLVCYTVIFIVLVLSSTRALYF